MRYIITQDKKTYKALCKQMPVFQTINGHTEKPTWIFLNQLNFESNDVEGLSFCLTDTLFF